MAMVFIGAGQFLIGAALATWGVGQLDRHDVLRRIQPTAPAALIRLWALTLTGFAIAAASPFTVLMG